MKYEYPQGYLIPAVNTQEHDYVACARVLAKSLKHWHPDARVCLLTDQPVLDPTFDIVKLLPRGDLDPDSSWKLANDSQCFSASPFHETIKLEADMLVSGPIDHWWSLFRHRDVYISHGCRNHRGEVSDCRAYRRIFDDNNLPDVYNAVTYWRVSRLARDFFNLVAVLFEHWPQTRQALKGGHDHPANTDLIYAMAVEFLGRDQFYIPGVDYPMIAHLKSRVMEISVADWTRVMVWELVDGVFRVNGHAQQGLVHYNKKSLAQDLEQIYDRYQHHG